MSELASEIRRIARGDKLKGPLGNAKERDPINGTFVPFTNTPQSQITANGAEGEDPVNVNSPPSNGAGEDPTDTDNQNDQPTDANDPNTFNKGSATQGKTSNTYDIEDVIDQTGDVPSTPNEEDHSNSDEGSTSGVIDHMNGATDCDTGQCINFHTDGNFPAPDGWDDADTPAEVNDWTLGYYYFRNAQPITIGSYASGEQIFAAFPEVHPVYGSLTKSSYTISAEPPTVGVVGQVLYEGVDGPLLESFSRGVCSPSEGDSVCPITAPTATQWPEDGCYDLALIDGQFQTNDYDDEAPAGAGGSKVNFCFGSGRTGTMEATANGGFMVYETSGGAPTGQATVYGKDGTFQAAGDATETFMDQWRPK